MWSAQGGAAVLLDCLPPEEEIMRLLRVFDERVQTNFFPHTPDEMTEREVKRFLADAPNNAYKYPDMLALLFATLAIAVQNSVYDLHGAGWIEGAMEEHTRQAAVFVAASMQALRAASFMNNPTLLAVETLAMLGPYLINAGRFVDAWVLFGLTIRLCQSIGLHRNPKLLKPTPPPDVCRTRQTIWWWVIHTDQQYSLVLGRPLGVTGLGDCPPPEPLQTNPVTDRLFDFITKFTIVSRHVVTAESIDTAHIDEFSDRVSELYETLPKVIQFDDTWLDPNKGVPDWPLDGLATFFHIKTQNLLILLNRKRRETTPEEAARRSSLSKSASGSQLLPGSPKARPRGRTQVLASARQLIKSVEFVQMRLRWAMICWIMCQQGFNAAMILVLNLLQQDVDTTPESEEADHQAVHRVLDIFTEMDEKKIHRLAGLACAKLRALLFRFEHLRAARAAANFHANDISAFETSVGAGPDQQPRSSGAAPGASATSEPEDTVMGSDGMFLLDGQGMMDYRAETFKPLSFHMYDADLNDPVLRPSNSSGTFNGAVTQTWPNQPPKSQDRNNVIPGPSFSYNNS